MGKIPAKKMIRSVILEGLQEWVSFHRRVYICIMDIAITILIIIVILILNDVSFTIYLLELQLTFFSIDINI